MASIAEKSSFSDEVAERNFLSIILNHPDSYFDVCDFVTYGDFFLNSHRIIMKGVEDLLEEDPTDLDCSLIRNRCVELGHTSIDEMIAGGEYLEALKAHHISPRNLVKVARRIKELSVKRRLLCMYKSLDGIVRDEKKKSTEIIAEIEREFAEVVTEAGGDTKIEVLGEGFLEWANEKADNPRPLAGLSSGLQRYDLAIGGGIRRGGITLIAAQKKNFKSGLALNVARHNAIECGIPVLYLDTELSREYQRLRFGAREASVPVEMIETGRWRSDVNVIANIKRASARMEGAPFHHTYVGGESVDRIIHIMKYWLTKTVKRGPDGQFNDCLIIYDYIKLMKASDMKNLTEWQQLGFYCSQLHDFVKKNNVPLFLLSQLNRQDEIAAADRILWYVSNFSILAHKTREEKEEDGAAAGNMKLAVKLTRHGAGMDEGDYLNLRVNHACMKVEEGKLRSELVPDEEDEIDADDEDDME